MSGELRTQRGQPGPQRGVIVAVITLPRALIILGGLAIVIGSLMPWATVSGGRSLSLVNFSFSVSVTPFDINAANALVMLVCGLATTSLGIWTAVALHRSGGVLVAAVATGVTAVAVALVTANGAQSQAGSLNWLQSFINVSSLVTFSVGLGFWIAVAGGLMAAIGGLLAYAGR
jgi:hypothetical protein